ncbi:MAG: hypothetical protein JO020_08140 [Chloroflexi bacterium]|nr:hypothetical protein [Chloroflexota bacterium]
MADIGRALRLGAVPIAALVNLLSIELLHASIEPPILARMITTVVVAKAMITCVMRPTHLTDIHPA